MQAFRNIALRRLINASPYNISNLTLHNYLNKKNYASFICFFIIDFKVQTRSNNLKEDFSILIYLGTGRKEI